jgi:hypothetical protein
MERREALKALAILTGGAVLVPSCNFFKEDILVAYKNLQVTPSLQQLLALVAETIIPAGKTKGAADLAVQDFILVMVNDCLDAEQRKKFMQGLNGFNDYSKKVGDKSFSKLTPEEKTKVVETGLTMKTDPDFKAPANEDEDDKTERENEESVPDFLKITKRFNIQGFMMSQYIQTEVKPFKLIPDHYEKTVLVSDIKKEIIHG